MKKFDDWLMENTSVGSIHYGRFLAQIMGWDSHGNQDTWWGKTVNFFRGKHQQAQAMGGDIFDLIENPSNIAQVIRRAQQEGVYQRSTFKYCYDKVIQWAHEYHAGYDTRSPTFQSMLLHNILGKCNKEMAISYKSALEFYEAVIGVNPAAYQDLHDAYIKDPQHLKYWLAIANTTHPPHPTFSDTDRTTLYWKIQKENIISPLNLIHLLIDEAPHKTLSLPKNKTYLNNMSVEFAEAYFPYIMNKRRGNMHTGGSSGTGSTLQDLIQSIQGNSVSDVDKTKGDGSAQTGKKIDLVNALASIIGNTAANQAANNADSGSLMATLKDHNTFFGINQIIEEEKK